MVDERLEKYPDEKIEMFTKAEYKMKRDFNPCQFYQTNNCQETNPVHHKITHDTVNGRRIMKTQYHLHVCDICSRYRNAYGQHAGAQCEFIRELDDREKNPNYKPKFMTKK